VSMWIRQKIQAVLWQDHTALNSGQPAGLFVKSLRLGVSCEGRKRIYTR
jgi:hypothetical protein